MRREPDFKDLNYQLGMYVGEYITFKHLPVLSTDALRTKTIVQVSQEDAERHREEEALRQEVQKGKGKGKNKGKGAIARYDSESSVDSDSSTVSTSSMRRHRIPPRSRPLTDAQLDRQVIRKLDDTQ